MQITQDWLKAISDEKGLAKGQLITDEQAKRFENRPAQQMDLTNL